MIPPDPAGGISPIGGCPEPCLVRLVTPTAVTSTVRRALGQT